MALRLECLNSVDGSTRFRALMGWFRLICGNGLVIGITRSDDPTTIPVQMGERVKGTPELSENLFDLSQILAWLAKERRDLQEQIEWREQIPELLAQIDR